MDSWDGAKWVPTAGILSRELERAELEQFAAGTLHEWMTGYTSPLADGAQRKVIATDYRDDGMTFVAAVGPGYIESEGRRYAVTVTVREVPA